VAGEKARGKIKRLTFVSLWRWRELNPRPSARTVRIYRFVCPFRLSGKGERNSARPFPYSGLCPRRAPDRMAGKPWLVADVPGAQGGAPGRPSFLLLTQRERGCLHCWHLKFCRNQELGSSTCNARHGPHKSKPVHPRSWSLFYSTDSLTGRQLERALSMMPPPRTSPSSE